MFTFLIYLIQPAPLFVVSIRALPRAARFTPSATFSAIFAYPVAGPWWGGGRDDRLLAADVGIQWGHAIHTYGGTANK
jgi:hypothetical protein